MDPRGGVWCNIGGPKTKILAELVLVLRGHSKVLLEGEQLSTDKRKGKIKFNVKCILCLFLSLKAQILEKLFSLDVNILQTIFDCEK
jgi:hypothetical protein